MHTITIKVSDNAYNKFISQLNDYDKNDMFIIEDESEFNRNKAYLKKELDEMEEGKATFHTLEEFEEILTKSIQNDEN